MNVHTSKLPRTYPDLDVAILAGGKSRRFGRDKASARLSPQGPTLLEQTAELASRLSDHVYVVGYHSTPKLGMEVSFIEDGIQAQGPLVGIASALRASSNERVLVLACDMPTLSESLLRWMIELDSSSDVLVPVTGNNELQPLHAIYRTRCLPAVDRSIATGTRSVRDFLERASIQRLPESELRLRDPELRSFFNVNRPEDLAEMVKPEFGQQS